MDLSIVIVNYNVKDYLFNCLTSIINSKHSLAVETIVVDNNSVDGSMDFLIPIFSDVRFIVLKENLGFAKANNIAIKQSKGKYILILNPDTILSEDTLDVMFKYMEENSNVGIAGCKVLNADGSFQVQCRRGFPSPWASFCKLFGFQVLFPKTKLFTKYNLLHLPINETYKIDSVIGAFMFCNGALIKELGGFDEMYFMYGEDIDLCKQVQLKGQDVMYVHTTTIIHYKGESSKRSGLNVVKHMYLAMEQFAKKYYSSSLLFICFLKFGILFRNAIAIVIKHIIPITFILSDALFINISLLVGTYVKFGNIFGFPDYAYPIVFIVVTAIFLLLQFLNGEYFEKKVSLPNTALSLMLTFFICSSLTYFLPLFRFSRSTILVMIAMTLMLTFSLRLFFFITRRITRHQAIRNIIIAGNDSSIEVMIDSLNTSEQQYVNIVGIVLTGGKPNLEANIPLLGNIEDINSIALNYDVNEVIVTDTHLPKSLIMSIMAENNSKVRFHFIPEYEELKFSRIINEFSSDKNSNLYYKILPPRHRFIKRILDIKISFIMLTLLLPVTCCLNNRKNIIKN